MSYKNICSEKIIKYENNALTIPAFLLSYGIIE
jgi:hypothetical protein